MPRLPVGIGGDSQIPSTGGVRGGTVGIPAAQEAGLDLGAATLPARALVQAGEQADQVGQYLVQAETYQAQRGRAQAALDSTSGAQVWVQEFQPAFAELLGKGNYRTLPEDAVKLGNDLYQKVAIEQNLSPEAKALFRVKTQEAVSHAQAKALEVKSKRFEQDASFTMAREVQQVQQEAMGIRDESELMMTMGRLEGTLRQSVHHGYLDAQVAANLYQTTEFAVRKDWGLRTIDAAPVARYQELLSMAQGQAATSPAFQHLPPQFIDPLLTHAAQQVQRVTQVREQERRQTVEERKQKQDGYAVQLTSQLYEVAPVPENLSKIDATLETIRQAGPQGLLEKNEYQQMLGMAQAWAEKARTYVPQDNEAIVKDLRIQLVSGQTAQDFRAVIQNVAAHQAALTGKTYQELIQDAESRSNRLHPLNMEAYKEGVKRILWYAGINPSSPAPFIAQQLRTADQVNTANTLLAYQSAIAKMPPQEIEAKGLDLADQMLRTYMRDTNNTADLSRLSQPLQLGGPHGEVVPNDTWAAHVLLRTPGMTDAELGRQFREWQDFRKTPKGLDILKRRYGDNPDLVPAPGAPTAPIGGGFRPGEWTPRPTQPPAPPSLWRRAWEGATTPRAPLPPSAEPKTFPGLRD